MICPRCGHCNLPGSDECVKCLFDLAPLDLPMGQDRVENSVMTDPVRVLQPKKPMTVPVSASLGLALQRMVDAEIGALLVIDERNKLVGILTERDYLTKIVGIIPDYAHMPLQPFMTSEPETLGPDDTLAVALHKMDVGGYRHLPVVENGVPTGIISVRDVIRHITQLCKEG
jgi:CBS domain-containing protein